LLNYIATLVRLSLVTIKGYLLACLQWRYQDDEKVLQHIKAFRQDSSV